MARLTPEEKENLKNNLHRLVGRERIPEVARLCNIQLRTFESYYYGEKSPSPERLLAIANHFSLTPSALISADMNQTQLEMKRTYNEISALVAERKDCNYKSIIDNFIHKHFSPIHSAFLQLCQNLDINLEYIPTYTIVDMQDITLDEEAGIDLAKVHSELDEKRFDSSLTHMEKFILAHKQKQGVSKEDAQKKLAQYRELVDMAEKMTSLTRKDDSVIKATLNQIANDIDKGEYSTDDITSLPLNVKITINKQINSLNHIKKMKGLEDLVSDTREYSLSELLDIEDEITDNIFELLFPMTDN